ncbi:thiamine-phosphate kinase [Aquibacillus albus]|uniref:Thiamine-monophosphate kinase n=1 Tax=Aquibacillus albus TaxID=1168171 RepID=A0ABS2N655_9BACI|nr:thiamine-phosphate kinase [Aquibacillus albus]MBM7573621.1 thiamine-monophosphate kinase [Aquibacillus albus]
MNEFEFIKSIQQRNYKRSGLRKGIGDDAAVFRQSYQDTVTAVDTFVENIHFSRKTMEPFHIGYRVLAANISDMAAMGCDPAYYLISIVIPKEWTEQELHEIYQGMNDIANQYKLDLIGGDTVSGSQLVISVTIIGFVDQNKARYRSDAVDGDVIFVTGTLGDAAAGFHLLSEGNNNDMDKYNYFIQRHRMPTPRIAFSNALKELNRVALNDISDGIANEANEIAEASHVTMNIHYDRIPIHQSLKDFSAEQQRAWSLSGGEDFELIGTVSEKDWPYVLEIAASTNTKVTSIGYVTNHQNLNGHTILIENGIGKQLNKSGYTHLK